MEKEDYVSPRMAAKTAGVSGQTMRRYVDEGLIEGVIRKSGRPNSHRLIPRNKLQEFLDRRAVQQPVKQVAA